MTARTPKLTVAALLTVDGVHGDPVTFAGTYFGQAGAERSMAALESCDAMLMGRGTYEYFAKAWPNSPGPYAARINTIAKYAFSSMLKTAEWNNTTVVGDDPVAWVTARKQQGGGDLMIYGYGRLAQSLLEHGLVDELKLTVIPELAGAGTPLLMPGRQVPLRLTSTMTYPNGMVELVYDPRPSSAR
jgi:dihydrofolate reductase